jgi:hypothetical protein
VKALCESVTERQKQNVEMHFQHFHHDVLPPKNKNLILDEMLKNESVRRSEAISFFDS